jgi:hypothetical protein
MGDLVHGTRRVESEQVTLEGLQNELPVGFSAAPGRRQKVYKTN